MATALKIKTPIETSFENQKYIIDFKMAPANELEKQADPAYNYRLTAKFTPKESISGNDFSITEPIKLTGFFKTKDAKRELTLELKKAPNGNIIAKKPVNFDGYKMTVEKLIIKGKISTDKKPDGVNLEGKIEDLEFSKLRPTSQLESQESVKGVIKPLTLDERTYQLKSRR